MPPTSTLTKVAHMTTAYETGRVPVIDLPMRLMIARSAAGFSQQQLAEKIGAARATVANYEAGKMPRRGTVMAWAVATDVDVRWLMTGEAPSPDGDGASQVRPKGFEPLTFWSGRLSLLPASMMEDAAA